MNSAFAIQATLQPALAWNGNANSAQPQPLAQPASALTHALQQVFEGRPARHAATGNGPVTALTGANEEAEPLRKTQQEAGSVRAGRQDGAAPKSDAKGMQSGTDRAPVQAAGLVSTRLGSPGASGQPNGPSSSAVAAEKAAADTVQEALALGNVEQKDAADSRKAEGQCSSWSHRSAPSAKRGAQKRVFATLEPELPRSLSKSAGYTDKFAFPEADGDTMAAASSAANEAAPEQPCVRGGADAVVPGAAGKANGLAEKREAGGLQGRKPGSGVLETEAEGGNASQSSPASPGTPGSPAGATRAAGQPVAAAAHGAGSASEDSGPADRPAAPSCTSGVAPPNETASAAASSPRKANRAAAAALERDPSAGETAARPSATPKAPVGEGAATESGDARAPQREFSRQDQRPTQGAPQQSGLVKQQGSMRREARPLVNPAMERARAASGSAGSLPKPARKDAAQSGVSPAAEAAPRQTSTAADAAEQPAAVDQAKSGATGTTLTVKEAGEASGTGAKRRWKLEGDSGESRAKRGRLVDADTAQPKPEQPSQRGVHGVSREVVPAQQPAAAESPGDLSLDVLAAAASSVAAAPVHCWPRRRTSLEGSPSSRGGGGGREAAAEISPGKAKRPSPLIKWPAAAEAVQDKSAPTSPARAKSAAGQPSPQAGRSPARARKRQLGEAAQVRAKESGDDKTPKQGTPSSAHALRDRSASARKSSKPWWVV